MTWWWLSEQSLRFSDESAEETRDEAAHEREEDERAGRVRPWTETRGIGRRSNGHGFNDDAEGVDEEEADDRAEPVEG